MNFLYNGCITRRSTSTVTVLSILSLVTRPVRTRFGIAPLSSGFHGGGALLLRHDRLHPRDVAAHRAHAAHTLVLSGRTLEPQVELLLAEVQQQRAQFV